VNADKTPRYKEFVQHPMDLGTIKQRVQANFYFSIGDFLSDVKLVRDNCYAYNSSWNHGILPVADYVLNTVSESVREVWLF
jgi:transcriptional activator SPT7